MTSPVGKALHLWVAICKSHLIFWPIILLTPTPCSFAASSPCSLLFTCVFLELWRSSGGIFMRDLLEQYEPGCYNYWAKQESCYQNNVTLVCSADSWLWKPDSHTHTHTHLDGSSGKCRQHFVILEIGEENNEVTSEPTLLCYINEVAVWHIGQPQGHTHTRTVDHLALSVLCHLAWHPYRAEERECSRAWSRLHRCSISLSSLC